MRKIGIVLVSLALASCGTRYKPDGIAGGYSDVQLNADTFQININGNGYTSRDRAQKLALLRAADLTLQHGGDRFVVLSGSAGRESLGSMPVTATRLGNTYLIDGGEDISRPTQALTIRIVGKPDPAYASALDANLISAQLKPQLQ